MFSVNFAKFLKTSFDCFLCLSVNFEKLFRSPQSTFGKHLISGTSCWISTTRPDARQCCIQMYFGTVWTIWAPKKLFFYIAMFHVKPKWNIVYKILKKKIFFQETQISFPKCIEHKIFLDTQLQLLGVWGYHLTIQSLTSRRRYALWMHHCREKVFHKCFSSILYKNKK